MAWTGSRAPAARDAHRPGARRRLPAHGRPRARHQRAHADSREAARVRGIGELGGADRPTGAPRPELTIVSAERIETMSRVAAAALLLTMVLGAPAPTRAA